MIARKISQPLLSPSRNQWMVSTNDECLLLMLCQLDTIPSRVRYLHTLSHTCHHENIIITIVYRAGSHVLRKKMRSLTMDGWVGRWWSCHYPLIIVPANL